MKEKLLVIDGNSIMNRGFYGLPLLTNKEGNHTNGLLGFFNIILKVIEECKPDYLCVAFDLKSPTFRHKMYEAYKGTRKPAPEELIEQLPLIRPILRSMNIKVLELEGYEADDILGTLAKRGEKEGLEVIILSGDRDLLQIASENITVSIPKTFAGKTETFNYKSDDVIREYGVTPFEFIDVKALQGDSSDNIPGVTKVGPKTAVELIQTYKNLEGIYDHIDEITRKALKENLINDKEKAFLSRTLATIEINAPVEVKISDCKVSDWLNESSYEILRRYELNSIIKKIEMMDLNSSEITVEAAKDEITYVTLDDFTDVENLLKKINKASIVGMSVAHGKGVSVSLGEKENFFIEFYGFITEDFLKEEICKAVNGKNTGVVTFDVKKLYPFIGDYREGFDDCEILAYLIDPLKNEYNALHIGERYLNRYLKDADEIKNDDIKASILNARNALLSVILLKDKVKELGMDRLYSDIEMPLSYVLYDMEKEGVLVNREELVKYSAGLSEGINRLEKKIYEEAGGEFNINSPKQLGEVLFERLGLPGGKKTKSGYSTAADVLEKLAGEYPIVNDILEFRTLSKLKSTYAEGLQNYIGEDGRIHTHFNQTITATGRISSTEPNLQNIPIRTELGRELRKVFYPAEGCVFVDADYSQIELRLMAHMSGDEKLIEAYRNNKDIHRATAALVFGKDFDDVTDLDRRNAKAVNFGIIYGISSYGLSQGLSISKKEAQKYIEDYFETYPDVKAFLDNSVETARNEGGTRTLFNRLRPIPEIKESNFMRRSFGERVAMNAPLQGTAADIMKIAMINIFKRLKNEGLKSKLIIQVHDEVLVETRIEEKEKVLSIVTEEMSAAADLKVKLVADAMVGNNWYEAH